MPSKYRDDFVAGTSVQPRIMAVGSAPGQEPREAFGPDGTLEPWQGREPRWQVNREFTEGPRAYYSPTGEPGDPWDPGTWNTTVQEWGARHTQDINLVGGFIAGLAFGAAAPYMPWWGGLAAGLPFTVVAQEIGGNAASGFAAGSIVGSFGKPALDWAARKLDEKLHLTLLGQLGTALLGSAVGNIIGGIIPGPWGRVVGAIVGAGVTFNYASGFYDRVGELPYIPGDLGSILPFGS